MMHRVSRALRLVPTQRDIHDHSLNLDERVEAVVEKIDSLEARVTQLEQERPDAERSETT